MAKNSLSMSVVLIGAIFIFLVLVLMIIPTLPFQITTEQQTIMYLMVLIVVGGLMVILMKNAKVI